MLFRVEWRWRTAFLTCWLTPEEVSHTNQPGCHCHRGWRWTAHLRLRDEDGMIYLALWDVYGMFFRVFFCETHVIFVCIYDTASFSSNIVLYFQAILRTHRTWFNYWSTVNLSLFSYVHIVFTIMFDLSLSRDLFFLWFPLFQNIVKISHMLHVWYIYLHLGHLWGKCW